MRIVLLTTASIVFTSCVSYHLRRLAIASMTGSPWKTFYSRESNGLIEDFPTMLQNTAYFSIVLLLSTSPEFLVVPARFKELVVRGVEVLFAHVQVSSRQLVHGRARAWVSDAAAAAATFFHSLVDLLENLFHSGEVLHQLLILCLERIHLDHLHLLERAFRSSSKSAAGAAGT